MKISISVIILLGYFDKLKTTQSFDLKNNGNLVDQSDILSQLKAFRKGRKDDCLQEVICKKVKEPVECEPVELQDDQQVICKNSVKCKPVTLAENQEPIEVKPVRIKQGEVVKAIVKGWDIDYSCNKPLQCIPGIYTPIPFNCIKIKDCDIDKLYSCASGQHVRAEDGQCDINYNQLQPVEVKQFCLKKEIDVKSCSGTELLEANFAIIQTQQVCPGTVKVCAWACKNDLMCPKLGWHH